MSSPNQHASVFEKNDDTLPRWAFGLSYVAKAHTSIGFCCLKSASCPLASHKQGIRI